MKILSKFKIKPTCLFILPLTSLFLGVPVITIAQDILPFPLAPSASIAKDTMEESTHIRRIEQQKLPADAPNILIILLDDVGPGIPDTYGGLIHTPNLSRVAKQGISYNQFHSTAMCSPTRAALLTGRNHTRVGNGQITELANDWDGFSGVIPKTSATLAEVLKNYGYSTAAFGKWHNTPTAHTTQAGPFDYWPTHYGFEHFYGFFGGEASQYDPSLILNTQYVDKPAKTSQGAYHLTDDLTDNMIGWMKTQKTLNPNKPLLMYWAPGAVHGPHQVDQKWANKYKGQFDAGWDEYRKIAFARQKKLGFIPKNAQLTPRPDSLPAWESIPQNERAFQTRLMEVFAGFVEHTDYNVGRMLDGLDEVGIGDNTLVYYIWGDNGSSAEGLQGTISEMLVLNRIPSKIDDHIRVLNEELGGLDALGTAKTSSMYHASWAWAGSTPFKGTKLVASTLGGTRQPLAVSWPQKIEADPKMRSQFHHVNDIAPTIYEILNITPPKVVNGFTQDTLDGVSMAYTFNNAKAEGQKHTQFFDIMGSRAIYKDGWMAGTFGPRVPWSATNPGMATWTPNKDVWELYNLKEDFTQANDLARKYPQKLEELKNNFMEESRANKNLPIGGALYTMIHPDKMLVNPATEYNYKSVITRIPEFTAPRLASRNNNLTIDVKNPDNANGVLFAMGGFGGGVSLFIQDGYLHYEYNAFEIERTKLKSAEKLPIGDLKIEVKLNKKPSVDGIKHLSSGDLQILVNGKAIAQGTIPKLVSFGFTVNETFDIGSDVGSPVSSAYYDQAPFAYNGKINNLNVKYTP